MSAKQALNDKLQGSVAAYLRCGGVVNNQIKKGLLLSLPVKNKIGKYLAKLQTRTWLCREDFQQCVGRANKVHETATLLLVTLQNIHRYNENEV